MSSVRPDTTARCSKPAIASAGRNWTIRRGATLDMTDGSRQVCEFDEGLYWNAGAARLPSHHQAMLGYCNELGVALEVEVNTNRGALAAQSVGQ
jgi:monoamine oxidase